MKERKKERGDVTLEKCSCVCVFYLETHIIAFERRARGAGKTTKERKRNEKQKGRGGEWGSSTREMYTKWDLD